METAYELSSCKQNGVFSSMFRKIRVSKYSVVNLFGFCVCEDGKQLLLIITNIRHFFSFMRKISKLCRGCGFYRIYNADPHRHILSDAMQLCQWSPSIIKKKCEVDSYVDVTRLYLSFDVKDKDTSIADLQQDLTSIHNWCFNNSLLIEDQLLYFADAVFYFSFQN